MNKIVPNLWFNDNAQEAAKFYTSIFPDSKIISTTYYTDAGKEIHGHKAGDILTVEFQILDQRFIGLNGGPQFPFTEAVSFIVECDNQDEINEYWQKLSAVPESEQCGWLKDKFGVSWQIVPKELGKMLTGGTQQQIERVMAVFMPMKKIVISELQKAYNKD